MKRLFIFLIIIPALIFFSCKKGPEAPTGSSRVSVSDASVDTLKATRAVISASIVSAGMKNLTDHGFCWSASPLPDISSEHVSLGSASVPGIFTYTITGLLPQSQYYLRSFVKDNNNYIQYSQQLDFTTPDLTLPLVTTAQVSLISSTSAQCGGEITNDGNGTISSRGVCWIMTGTPSLSHCDVFTTEKGTDFKSYISGLMPETTYQVTAYATNEKGTSYGAVRSFSTRLPCGQATVEYGSTTYHTVLIGTQCWFKENLNIGTRINGSQNQDPLNQSIEKYCFNDDTANCSLYGGLYQWDEMMKNTVTPGAQGICPAGWHIPSDEEWSVLTVFLGGDSVAGTKLKSATGWYNNGNGTNTSGFTGLPGGNRGNDGSFNNLTQLIYFWTSSEAGASEAWNRKLNYDSENVTKYNSFTTNGFSVRCLRNN